jgi:hypothetical protein
LPFANVPPTVANFDVLPDAVAFVKGAGSLPDPSVPELMFDALVVSIVADGAGAPPSCRADPLVFAHVAK